MCSVVTINIRSCTQLNMFIFLILSLIRTGSKSQINQCFRIIIELLCNRWVALSVRICQVYSDLMFYTPIMVRKYYSSAHYFVKLVSLRLDLIFISYDLEAYLLREEWVSWPETWCPSSPLWLYLWWNWWLYLRAASFHLLLQLNHLALHSFHAKSELGSYKHLVNYLFI